MALTPYNPINWTKGPIDSDKLQAMSNNDQWLFENTPRILYLGPQIKRSESMKIAAGRAFYPGVNNDNIDVNVYFGGFFSVGCNPAVVVTVQSNGLGKRRLATVKGFNTNDPDHRGFYAHISTQEWTASNKYLTGGGFLHWMATGW